MEKSPDSVYLLKPGELTLKGGNRGGFEEVLRRNLQAMLRGTGAQVLPGAGRGRAGAEGRFFVRCPAGREGAVEEVLGRVFGISGWAKTRVGEKKVEAVLAACVEEGRLLREQGLETFKIEARRTDKSFPLDSYGIRCEGGRAVCAGVPGLRVDVQNPGGIIRVEIRERAYVYGNGEKGLRGLPPGTAGRGLLLLSGGIDSPVAGYLMASRGMRTDAVYFHAWPYTSEEARQKVIRLAEILGRYSLGVRLYTVGFTEVQRRIREAAPPRWATVLLRMAMMDCAEKLALKTGAKCLVSGESLSQVASQTIENMSCVQCRTGLPVLRPLVGLDKEDIIRLARTAGTYETSILPYEDCCVLFSPPHPVLRGKPEEALALYEKLDAAPLIEGALKSAVVEKCSFPDFG